MKIWSIFKSKENVHDNTNNDVVATECDHDWETVRSANRGYMLKVWDRRKNKLVFREYVRYRPSRVPIHHRYTPVCDAVCLKCGKCHRGIEKMEKWFTEEIEKKGKEMAEAQKRHELAKRMWEDCNGKR